MQLSETQQFFIFILTMLAMMAITTYILNRTLLSVIRRGAIVLTSNHKRTLKWGISFVVTILTGHFCLLYLLLLR